MMLKIVGLVIALIVSAAVAVYFVTGGMYLQLPPVTCVAVNARTDTPLAGVVVAARWRTSSLWCIHGDCYVEVVRNAEAVTDNTGRAFIPGSKIPRKGLDVVHHRQPEATEWKAGFVPTGAWKGTKLFRPVVSHAEGIEAAQAARDSLGSEPWQFQPAVFPRLAGELELVMEKGSDP